MTPFCNLCFIVPACLNDNPKSIIICHCKYQNSNIKFPYVMPLGWPRFKTWDKNTCGQSWELVLFIEYNIPFNNVKIDFP